MKLIKYTTIFAILIISFYVFYIINVYVKISTFRSSALRMQKLLEKLDRVPSGTDPTTWEESVTLTKIACANVCHSYTHVNNREMKKFCDDLEFKLKDKISDSTLLWIWSRLERTGPWGNKYVSLFKKNFDSTLGGGGIEND